jgi:hypothetical protein
VQDTNGKLAITLFGIYPVVVGFLPSFPPLITTPEYYLPVGNGTTNQAVYSGSKSLVIWN